MAILIALIMILFTIAICYSICSNRMIAANVILIWFGGFLLIALDSLK